MKIYHFDELGVFVGVGVAERDPLDKGKYLVPRNAVALPVLEELPGYNRVINGSEWEYIAIPEPESEPVIEPVLSATKLALYELLYASGDWPQIAAALAADEYAGNVWQFASIIDRGHPLVEQFRQLLGWTAEQVDDLFRAAQ
jgi:hypothetical protein